MKKKAIVLSMVSLLTCGLMLASCGGDNTETSEISTHDHVYGDWVITKEAGCEETGEETRTCSICGKKETRSIPNLGGHINTDDKWYYHDGEYDKDYHYKKCDRCGEEVEKQQHQVPTPAGCELNEKTGEVLFSCLCGKQKSMGIYPTNIILDENAKMKVGETLTLHYSFEPSNVTEELNFMFDTKWNGYDIAEASYDTKAKTVTIHATGTGSISVKIQPKYSWSLHDVEGFCVIQIEPKELEVTDIQKETEENISLEQGESYQLQPILTPSSATNANLTFISEDETVAEVTENGNVRAGKVGETNIIVSSKANPNIKVEYHIVVERPAIRFSQDLLTLYPGQTINIYDYIENATIEDNLRISTDRINAGYPLGYDSNRGELIVNNNLNTVGYHSVKIENSDPYGIVDTLNVLVLPDVVENLSFKTLAEINETGRGSNPYVIAQGKLIAKYLDGTKYMFIVADETGGISCTIKPELYDLFEVGDSIGYYIKSSITTGKFKKIISQNDSPFKIEKDFNLNTNPVKIDENNPVKEYINCLDFSYVTFTGTATNETTIALTGKDMIEVKNRTDLEAGKEYSFTGVIFGGWYLDNKHSYDFVEVK